jgi:hypothetical protein
MVFWSERGTSGSIVGRSFVPVRTNDDGPARVHLSFPCRHHLPAQALDWFKEPEHFSFFPPAMPGSFCDDEADIF